VNPASTSPRNLIGLYSAWRLDGEENLPHPTECAPDLHIEMRIATFLVEPAGTMALSAAMARREAFPLEDFEVEELGTRFVDDATAARMDDLGSWIDLPASGKFDLVERTRTWSTTLGRARLITDPADLVATLKRHGLPEAWATDHNSDAWKKAPRRGPSIDEFIERVNDFVGEYNEREARHRKTAANKSRGEFER